MMFNNFYEKRSDIEDLLKNLGFEKAGEYTIVGSILVRDVAYWFTEGYIVSLSFTGGMSQLVDTVVIYKVNKFFVKQAKRPVDIKACFFLSEYQHWNYSDVEDGFLEVFSKITTDSASRKEKISVVYENLNKLSHHFKEIFNKQLDKLFIELNTDMQYDFPDFYLGDDSRVHKSLKVYNKAHTDYLLHTCLGDSDCNATPAEIFNKFPCKSIKEEDVISLVDSFAKKCAGIFDKNAIREYVKLCSANLEEIDLLEVHLDTLPEYPFKEVECIGYDNNHGGFGSRPQFNLAKLGEFTVISYLKGATSCSTTFDFSESGKCLFQSKYIEPSTYNVISTPVICEMLYNMLAWFPEKYNELCNIVVAYMEFFSHMQKNFIPCTLPVNKQKNPHYLKDEDLGGAFNEITPKRTGIDFTTPSKTRITTQMTLMDAIVTLSGCNPGAATVLASLSSHVEGFNKFAFMLNLDTLGVYESKIYRLYKDVCNEDIDTVIKVLYNYRYGKLTKDDIHTQIAKGSPFENLLTLTELKHDFGTEFDSITSKYRI